MSELLRLESVDAGYGPFRALFGVSFSVAEHSAVALLGPNGAGKTTVARVCSGLVVPTAGRLWFAGDDVTGRRAYELARLGISHAPEGRSVFASLSVEENLQLAFRQLLGTRRTADALARAFELFPRLGERRAQLAGSLSGGEQRMLALARVMVNPPRLLVVDELSLGLAPIITEEVYRHLARIKEQGTALLIVEQQLEHALGIADHVVVLNAGEVRYDGPPADPHELARFFLPVEAVEHDAVAARTAEP